mgnify:CR=1 FL=1
MATMDSIEYTFPRFAASKPKSLKKKAQGASSKGSQAYDDAYQFGKSYGMANYYQYPGLQSQNNSFYAHKKTSKQMNMAPSYAKGPKGGNYGKQSNQYNYVYYSSTAESDNCAQPASELTGFKIVQCGKVVHDEMGEEFDLFSDQEKNIDSSIDSLKFAASTLTIGPDVKTISLPSFA